MSYPLNLRTWVEALEDGSYKQTCGVLNNGNGEHCCLGVAATVAGVPTDVTIYEDDGWRQEKIVYRFTDGEGISFWPTSLCDELEALATWDGENETYSFVGHLMQLNDRDHTFKEIAAEIRCYVPNLDQTINL